MNKELIMTIATTSMDKDFRIRQALKETTYLLNKELDYPVDLQKTDMVVFYRQHIANLTARLKNL